MEICWDNFPGSSPGSSAMSSVQPSIAIANLHSQAFSHSLFNTILIELIFPSYKPEE